MSTTIAFNESPGIGLAVIIITLKCCHESEPFFVRDRTHLILAFVEMLAHIFY